MAAIEYKSLSRPILPSSSSSSSSSSSPSSAAVSVVKDLSLSKRMLFSGLSGSIATTVIYPIDIIKTKLMNQHGVGSSLELKGPVQAARRILSKEGLQGLYRGWPPNVIFVIPEKAIKLTANDYFRHRFSLNGPLTLPLEMLSGGLAGFCQVIATNPMELLKIQGATVSEKIKAGVLKQKPSYVQLMKELKLSGLYTGVLSTLARDVPFSIVYFPCYAQVKAMLLDPSFSFSFGPFSAISSSSSSSFIGLKSFLAGAIAGTTAAALTCPIDVIKTRVHAAAKPLPHLSLSEFVGREATLISGEFRNIMATEGPKALFKGIIPRCVIISPLFAITMACYETFKQTFA